MSPSTPQDPFQNWTVQARKGLLELWVLRALAASEWYGYDLVNSLISDGSLGITEGTLYPLLSRLRVQGLVSTRLVESSSGPARKYYHLTPAGKRQLSQMNQYWTQLNSMLETPHD
ncbi:MAG: PadR family transcriptional regulator [Kiritimatiellia bacterium]